jgi:hypothetical protein
MVEAGARESPRSAARGARARARRDPQALRGQEELARRPASRSGSTRADRGARARHGDTIRERIQRRPARGAARRRGARRASSSRRCRWSRPRTTSSADPGPREPRADPRAARLEPSRAQVREQFESELQGSSREAEQDSKEAQVRQAASPLRADRRGRDLPFPVGPAPPRGPEGPVVKYAFTSSNVKRFGGGHLQALVRRKIASRSGADGRGTTGSGRSRGDVSSLRAPGSAHFTTAGQTQIMFAVTLVTARRASGSTTSRSRRSAAYMHHYNFPPFSVGETGLHAGARSGATSATARSRSGRSRP